MTSQSLSTRSNSVQRRVFLFVMLNILMLSFAANIFSGTVSSIPTNPTKAANVTVSFDGLMVLTFGNSERVSVGLLDAMEHVPEISIMKIKDHMRSQFAILKGDQLHRSIYIKTASGSGAVKRYFGESAQDLAKDPKDFKCTVGNNTVKRYVDELAQNLKDPQDPQDFRWTVDLENDIFQKQLHLQENKLYGKIHFSAGLFYTARLSDNNIRFSPANNALNYLHTFNRQIGEPAAKIDIAQGDALVIEGLSKAIRLVAEPGVSYEINISNLPDPSMASMEHFEAYYDLIGDTVTPYVPVMFKKAAYTVRTPLICLPATLSKSALKD